MEPPARLLSIDLVRVGDVNPYHALGGSPGAGLLRSVVFAWAVVRLSAWLATRGLRLRV